MTVAWTEPALDDLTAIHTALARDSEPYASRVLERLMESVERAQPVPRLGRVVAELGDERIRELIFRTYRVVYRVEPRQLTVLTVLHGGRGDDRREPRRWEMY